MDLQKQYDKLQKEQKEIAILLDFQQKNMSVKELAEKYSVSQHYVYTLSYKYGVKIKHTDKVYKGMAEAYKNGVSIEDIAKENNKSVWTIRRALRLEHVKIKRVYDITDKQQFIIDKLKNGESQAAIARELGITRQYVNIIYKRFIKGE